jgi:hypothetical protein
MIFMASYRVRQRRVKQREWAGLIADYRSSGLGAKKWCAVNHVSYDQLKYRLYTSRVEQPVQRVNDPQIPVLANTSIQPASPETNGVGFTTGSFTKATARWLPVEIQPENHDSDPSLLIRIGAACIEVKPGFDPALLKGVVEVLSSC